MNHSSPDPTRLLQVLADTEASEQNLSGLELHKALTRHGWAVRTLALAPGRRADLATKIPVMAPARRSFAAVAQFRTEQAWADLVLLRGIHTVSISRLAGSGPPRLLALSSEPGCWSDASRISRLDRYLLGSVDVVVAGSQLDANKLLELDSSLDNVAVAATSPPETAVDTWLKCLTAALPSRP